MGWAIIAAVVVGAAAGGLASSLMCLSVLRRAKGVLDLHDDIVKLNVDIHKAMHRQMAEEAMGANTVRREQPH